MKYTILTGTDNPQLREVSKAVPGVTKDIKKLIRDLKDTMHATGDGIGLAAPQVGVQKRIVLITLFREVVNEKGKVELEAQKELAMINPEIQRYTLETDIQEEGCLSVPGFYGDVERPLEIEVTFMNEKGATQTLQLSGLNAREVQHEIDHLDGILFTDKLVSNKKVEFPMQTA